jgi:3-oxoacyl-[acyl-carrier-protein] synthase III
VSATLSIVRTASMLPGTAVSNHEIGEQLAAGVSSDDDDALDIAAKVRERAQLLEKKVGVRSRRFFRADESPVGVGLELLERLMEDDPWSGLDALIVSSSSAHGFPGVSQQIVAAARSRHPELGAPFVLDIGSNACTSFMYAMAVGTSIIKGMGFGRVACLAIEFSSRCIPYDPLQFGISTLFGDAAAGVLLGRGVAGMAAIRSIRASSMIDAQSIDMIRGGGMQASRMDLEVPVPIRWYMAGPPVAVGATRILVEEIQRYQAEGARIDWLIPHQANLTRILIPACEKTGIDPSRLCSSFAETGNTSSASIPLLLDQLLRGGLTQPGQSALLVGFGASYTIGSALLDLDPGSGAGLR